MSLGPVHAARAALGVLHVSALAALPDDRRAVALDALQAVDHQLNRLTFALDPTAAPPVAPSHGRTIAPGGGAGEGGT